MIKHNLEIREAFNNVKKDINDLKEKQKELKKQLHTFTAPTTACSTAPTTARNKLKTSEKRLLKRLDSVKLMKSIQSCIDQGYSTSVIRDDIMNQFNIKERCFYNYLKKVHKQLHVQLRAVIKN